MPLPIVMAGLAAMVGASIYNVLADGSTKPKRKEPEECTVTEAAELLGISEYTVKKKIRDGELEGRIVGKKYMIPTESINEYSKRVGKSGQILGQSTEQSTVEANPELKFSKEIWNSPILLQDCIDSAKLQQNILSIEIQKLELSKKIAARDNDEDEILKISKEILDTEIKTLNLSQTIKMCEAQIHHLEEADAKSD